MTDKDLYKGEFNWQGMCFKLFTHSYSQNKALSAFLFRLSKILELPRQTVANYFLSNTKDNYRISKLQGGEK